MAHLNVNPADVLRAAADYTELQARAAAISPQAVAEVQRIAATYTGQDHEAAKTYNAPADMFDIAEDRIDLPMPQGRVICTEINADGFGCSEFLPGGMVFHFWLSPVDLTGHWPDFPRSGDPP